MDLRCGILSLILLLNSDGEIILIHGAVDSSVPVVTWSEGRVGLDFTEKSKDPKN